MKKEQTLLLETFYYGFGRFGSKIISFFLLPVFTQYLSTSDYGILELINTTAALVVPLLSFELFKAMYRYILDKSEKPWKIYSVSINYILFSSLVFLTMLFLIVKLDIISYEFIWYVAAMYLLSVFNSFHLQYLRATGNVKAFAVIGIVSTLISAVINIVLIVILHLGYISIILSSVFTSFLSLLFIIFYFKTYRIYKFYFDVKLFQKMMLYTLPLLPNSMSWWIINLSDRYILKIYKNLDSVGLYSIANKFVGIYLLFLTIFYSAWQTHAIEYYNDPDRDKYYSKVFAFFIFLQLTIIIAGIMLIKPVVHIMVDSSFTGSWIYIPILLTGTFFYGLSSFLGTGYLSSKKTSGAFFTTIYAAAANLLINLLLIPHFGLWAASFSTLAAYLILFSIRYFDTKKYFSLTVNWKIFFIGLLISILSLVSVLFTPTKTSFVICLSLLVLWIILNKNLVRSFTILVRGIGKKNVS